MTARDRTTPVAHADFDDRFSAPAHREPHRNFRFIVDVSAILAVAGMLVGGGMAWQRFLDDGQRLDHNDQEIEQLTQIEQQQQQTLAALSQNVADIKESVEGTH